MKYLLIGLFCLLSYPIDAQEWQLVWSDEFNSNGLDTSKWSYQIGTGTPLIGWGNNELQYYTNRPVNVDVFNGNLWIVAQRENFGGMQYTSARLRTRNKGDWRYGRIEMRAKLPTGRGLWPAFWMLPTDEVFGGWPQSGEIDIMELVGHEPNRVHGTIHFGNPWPQNQWQGTSWTLPQGTFNDDFHTFAIEWQQNEIKWFVDSTQYFVRVPANLGTLNWPFNERFHIILNVAVGGNWPGSPNASTVFPQAMVVDYVRVYQRAPLTTPTMQKPSQFTLEQNYPNPFNPTTVINYELATQSNVKLEVFDMLGRSVATLVNARQSEGKYSVNFNSEQFNLATGIYFYRLTAGSFSQTRKMILTK
ncbi:MAG: family 16 glycosylhydrolase [Chloroherpetonaceae bacterium]